MGGAKRYPSTTQDRRHFKKSRPPYPRSQNLAYDRRVLFTRGASGGVLRWSRMRVCALASRARSRRPRVPVRLHYGSLPLVGWTRDRRAAGKPVVLRLRSAAATSPEARSLGRKSRGGAPEGVARRAFAFARRPRTATEPHPCASRRAAAPRHARGGRPGPAPGADARSPVHSSVSFGDARTESRISCPET
jgi:hypothetical protein